MHCWWDCNGAAAMESNVAVAQDVKNRTTIYMIQQSHFWVCTQKNQKHNLKETFARSMFVAVLLTTSKKWKQPKCPLMNKWIKKMEIVYTYDKILFGFKKERKLVTC